MNNIYHFLQLIGERDEDGRIIPYENDKNTVEIKADEDAYLSLDEERKFYTRPLIDYDMALFLAPMEMAGTFLLFEYCFQKKRIRIK